jgi:hypothetical protein
MKVADRKRIAEQRIAEALNVTHKTISKDLNGFVPEVQTYGPHCLHTPAPHPKCLNVS